MDDNMRILNTVAALAIPFIPRALIQKISRCYIAGDSLADAVERVQMLNACGFSTTLVLKAKLRRRKWSLTLYLRRGRPCRGV
jgi:hypothetical protein